MLNYLFNLLPAWAQRLIEPQVDDLVAGFTKLETKFNKVIDRHVTNGSILERIQAEIQSEIEDTKAELERARRVAARIKALVD